MNNMNIDELGILKVEIIYSADGQYNKEIIQKWSSTSPLIKKTRTLATGHYIRSYTGYIHK